RTLARRTRGLERAERLRTSELGGGVAQPRERERRGETAAEHRDALLELFEPAAELVLEFLGGHLVEVLHLVLERPEIALHELRGLLEGVSLRERLADADHLLHRVHVVVVIAVGRRLHQALLRPVNELARRDVADTRGLGGGEAEAR